jgi:hypothetical protein
LSALKLSNTAIRRDDPVDNFGAECRYTLGHEHGAASTMLSQLIVQLSDAGHFVG